MIFHACINKITGEIALDDYTNTPVVFVTRAEARDNKESDETIRKVRIVDVEHEQPYSAQKVKL